MTIERIGRFLDTGAKCSAYCMFYILVRGIIIAQFNDGINLGIFGGNSTKVAVVILLTGCTIFISASLLWRLVHQIRANFNERVSLLVAAIIVLVLELFFI